MKLAHLKLPLIVAGLIALGFAAGGCQGGFVERAEKAHASSLETVDGFLVAEDAHRAEVRRDLPAVHEFAENLRRTAPPLFRLSWNSIQSYKAKLKADPNADATPAQRTLDALADIASQARSYLDKINQKGAAQ